MTATAGNSVFAFGPQPAKDTYAHAATLPKIFRHRSIGIDMDGVDDVRLAPPEMGGFSTPSSPYKVGQLATGGVTLYPRLAGSFGYLLYAATGSVTSTNTTETALINATTLTSGSADVSVKSSGSGPHSPATKVFLLGARTGATKLTGNAIIYGTDSADAAQFETIALNDVYTAWSTKAYKTITRINLPAKINVSGDTVLAGYGLYTHVFKFDQTAGRELCIPWLTSYKFIPGGDCGTSGSANDLWEFYKNNKVLGLNMALATEVPATSRIDLLGTMFEMATAMPFAAYSNPYEGFESIPLGPANNGYVKIPGFSASELPAVGATFSLVNSPLDIRQERIIGSSALDDVTVVARAASIDMVLKWRDPTLYRRLKTGSTTGTTWSEKPFTVDLDLKMVSAEEADNIAQWSLRIEAPSILLAPQGGVVMAPQQAVMMRVVGSLLQPSTGDYVTFTLVNGWNSYAWPTT